MNVQRIFKHEKKFLLFLFVFSFLVRAAVFHFYLGNNENFWQVDSNTYHVTAVQVSEGDGFSLPNGKPNFYRLPGYPLFLSIYYNLFGEDKRDVLWWQIFLASFIPLLIFFLSLTLFPARNFLAKATSMYSSVHLGLVLYSGFFMTESLFILFLLLFFILFFSSTHLFFCSDEKKPKRSPKEPDGSTIPFVPEANGFGPDFIDIQEELYAKEYEKQQKYFLKNVNKKEHQCYIFLLVAGFLLGIASLIRPVGHYLIILSILMILFSKNWWEDKIGKSIILFLGWLIPVLFWLIRNYLLIGHIFFHTLPGGHFLYLSAARTAMHVHNTSYEKARHILKKEVGKQRKKIERKFKRRLDEFELCKLREKIAIKYFLKRPLITLKNWITDIFRTCFSLYSAELLRIEAGGKEIQFFKKNRTFADMFKRYLFPQTKSTLIRIIIILEILLFLFLLLGFILFIATTCFNFFSLGAKAPMCLLAKILPFMLLFIVISLAGGYARMRLPIEPFLSIASLRYWLYFKKA